MPEHGLSPGVAPEVLSELGMPERVGTPFGTLEFFDGLPLPASEGP
jgi:hypothetical protein